MKCPTCGAIINKWYLYGIDPETADACCDNCKHERKAKPAKIEEK